MTYFATIYFDRVKTSEMNHRLHRVHRMKKGIGN